LIKLKVHWKVFFYFLMASSFSVKRKKKQLTFRSILISSFLVMSCGYTLIESGGVRSQNAGHSLFKTLLILSMLHSQWNRAHSPLLFENLVTTTIAYWVTGYAFAFGSYPNVILGTRYWVSERFGAKEDRRPGVENFTGSNPVYNLNNQDPYIHYFYHSMLAFLVTNIAASAFAERCRVPVYILFSILMSGKIRFEFNCLFLFIYLFIWIGFVYPFLSHWMWGAQGWLGAIVGARVNA